MKKSSEDESVESASALPTKLIYEVIRREGEEELQRPIPSLVWSGITAGLMMSFSLVGEAILRTHLGEAPTAYLIENLGYSLGFLLVILGRLQLFTENTITTVLPVMAKPTVSMLGRTARLWSVVLGANVLGALLAAALLLFSPMVPAEIAPALIELSQHGTGLDAATGFARAVPAGLLVAALVWMLPQASSNAFWVIVTFTWLIAAGDFTHIIVGSVEMWYRVLLGDLGLGEGFARFFLPVLAGNVVGGTAVFALLAFGQVVEELDEDT